VILGDGKPEVAAPEGGTTLDAIFRRTVARRPAAIALVDPPNREAFTDGAPRRLSYAQADRIVSAIAARLRRLGLGTDAVVAMQLPNTVEAVLTVLGVLRAGMIAAPLPLLWRRADLVAALRRSGAKAIVTASRVGGVDHGDHAAQAAAELFPVRFVCGFGSRLKDGVMPFDELLTEQPEDAPPATEREGDPAAHVAVVTFDVTPQGLVAVARNHAELVAGGLAMLLESRIEQDATILACCTTSSFAGLALTVAPWLLAGGTLLLHQPFDPDVFAMQCSHGNGLTVALPAALVPRLAAAGLLAHPAIKTVIAVWRTPERMMASPPWCSGHAGLVDVSTFGETALFGALRGADGKPEQLPAGVLRTPRGAADAVTVLELVRTETGTLAVRGPMVPQHPFPPGAERTPAPHVRADAEGFADTGYACRLERDSGALAVTRPPPGLVTVGGYRFMLRDLEETVRRADRDAGLAALPDTLSGHRLAGHAADPESVRAALAANGVNALLVDAFVDRRGRDAA
jgi:non-ribosomal peptide synthetase component E (peptide arylation enzyme)